MKKIINGKKYDTETATLLGAYDNGCNCRDFSHEEERLYQKATGEFFKYGYGGPMSKYARAIGVNTWSGSEEIMPISEHEARRWAERHLSVDVYEGIFGAVAE